MPKVVVKCIDVRGHRALCLCFCTGIDNVRDRVITWDKREIALLTDLRCSELQKLGVGEEFQIC